MLLSAYEYCVAITFKMTEQRICIKFCIKLEHSSMETIQMIQKAAAMRNWRLAAALQQHACSCIMSRAEFFFFSVKHQITQVIQSPYSPELAPWDFRLFPKLKLPLKGKRFQTVSEIQESMTEQLMAIGRTVWGPKVPTLNGTEVSFSYVQLFLYLLQ